MRVIWSPLAIYRAEEIATYSANDRPMAATKWVDQLFSEVTKLTQFPRSGRMVPEVGREELRELIFDSVRVVYRLEEKKIVILTLRNQRQAPLEECLDGMAG